MNTTMMSGRRWSSSEQGLTRVTLASFSTSASTSASSGERKKPVTTRVHGMMLRRFESEDKEKKPRPMAVVVGWMLSKDSQMKHYLSHYHKLGFDTLSFGVGPMHILRPEMGMEQMRHVLDTLIEAKETKQSSPEVLFHCFSVGGFLFGQCLRCMDAHPETYGKYKQLIKAQIFDSPPDMGSIATGIAKGIHLPAVLETPVERALSWYLKATESSAGVHYEQSRQAFFRNEAQAPALWFYSKSDPISRWQDCEYVWKRWKEQGQDITVQSWEDTPHIQHARLHPDVYFGTLNKFLKRTAFKEYVE